jgi:hypothetical protein
MLVLPQEMLRDFMHIALLAVSLHGFAGKSEWITQHGVIAAALRVHDRGLPTVYPGLIS